MATNCKLSDLTTQETGMFLQVVKKIRQKLSEDEDERVFIAALDYVAAEVAKVEHVPFLDTDFLLFTEAKIIPNPLTIISNKIPKLESLGIGNQLAVNQTKDLISVIRAHISYSTRCCILVNAILLHVVSNLSNGEVNISIVPYFEMVSAQLEDAAPSYEGIVDFLIIKGPLEDHQLLLIAPQFASLISQISNLFSSNIYQTKTERIWDAIPHAVMADLSFCKQHNFSTSRSCVTNGEDWLFFIFNAAESGEGGAVAISEEFSIKKDLSGLPLVLGVLSDWIINSKEKEQQYFVYRV